MYKRHTGQVSMLETPEMFGSLPLDPNNDWIKLSKLVPWREFDLKYADNFRSKKGQRAIDSRMALGALLIKPAYKALSDEDITKEIAMNPYLQYFLGLHEYRYECPFDPSMMTRFRQRITPEMLAWVNDQIIGRKTEQDKPAYLNRLLTVLPERFAADPKASIDDLMPWNQEMRRTLLPNSSDTDH